MGITDMPRKKTTKKTSKKATATKTAQVEDKVETPILEPEIVAVEESDAKKAFRAYMESYKVENPVKYKLKEQAFITHLNSL